MKNNLNCTCKYNNLVKCFSLFKFKFGSAGWNFLCFDPKDNGNGFQRGETSDSRAWWKITADHF